jgi:hypothetical protein
MLLTIVTLVAVHLLFSLFHSQLPYLLISSSFFFISSCSQQGVSGSRLDSSTEVGLLSLGHSSTSPSSPRPSSLSPRPFAARADALLSLPSIPGSPSSGAASPTPEEGPLSPTPVTATPFAALRPQPLVLSRSSPGDSHGTSPDASRAVTPRSPSSGPRAVVEALADAREHDEQLAALCSLRDALGSVAAQRECSDMGVASILADVGKGTDAPDIHVRVLLSPSAP